MKPYDRPSNNQYSNTGNAQLSNNVAYSHDNNVGGYNQ